jgi:pilus assembly protein CpaE
MQSTVNAVIVTNDTDLRKAITQCCASHQPEIHIVSEFPGMNPKVGVIAAVHPSFVFLDGQGNEKEVLDLLQNTTNKYPQAAILLLASLQSATLLLAAMRNGVREVVELPLSANSLHEAIDRILSQQRESSREEGKILSFISCKGGSGTTFIADNLAYALASVSNKKVLLIDLNLQFGDAALFLSDAQPSMTLADLCRQIHRLDAALLDSSLIHVTPSFGILPASGEPDPYDTIRTEQIDAILHLARQEYDFVFIDLGRQINGIVIRALDQSDHIFPIIQQSLPYLRNGLRLLGLFKMLGYRKEKIRVIVNRHETNTITVDAIERSLGQMVAHLVPNNFDVVNESINQGVPVLKLARSCNVTKALVEIINAFADVRKPDSSSIIRRLFVRN